MSEQAIVTIILVVTGILAIVRINTNATKKRPGMYPKYVPMPPEASPECTVCHDTGYFADYQDRCFVRCKCVDKHYGESP